MARIGVFGGSFDPIHLGHLLAAEQAREKLGLKRVLFVPLSHPAMQKQHRVSCAHCRLQMCELAVAHNPYFEVSDVDVVRGGLTYTVDTLSDLRATISADDELVFITGADAACTLPSWYEAPKLAQLAQFAVLRRPGSAFDASACERLAQAGFRTVVVDCAQIDISSTEIRRRIECGLSVRYMLPAPVADFISEFGLYGAHVAQ